MFLLYSLFRQDKGQYYQSGSWRNVNIIGLLCNPHTGTEAQAPAVKNLNMLQCVITHFLIILKQYYSDK